MTTLYQGFTALHLACWRGGVRVVRRLLNSPGGSPTLVWFAFWPFYSWGYLDQFCFLRYSDEGEKHWGSHSPGGCNGVEARTRCQGFFWSPSSTFFHLLPPSSTFFHLLPHNPRFLFLTNLACRSNLIQTPELAPPGNSAVFQAEERGRLDAGGWPEQQTNQQTRCRLRHRGHEAPLEKPRGSRRCWSCWSKRRSWRIQQQIWEQTGRDPSDGWHETTSLEKLRWTGPRQ